MQDIHTIGVGGGGRLYGGGGGGDRRLRTHHHPSHPGQSPKCPRCDSANTKFCYYNNYNLSQPRHFCKSCRRYWTKGGVLRNVPVGGGCRKTKRNSSAKPKPSSDRRKDAANSQSSSDSSSLTASTAAPASEVVSTVVAAAPRILDFSQDPITSSSDPSDSNRIFTAIEAGSFTSLMTSSSDPLMELNFAGVVEDRSLSRAQWTHQQGIVDSTTAVPEVGTLAGLMTSSSYRGDGKDVRDQSSGHQQWTHQQQGVGTEEATTAMPEELKMKEIAGGFLDQTAQMELSGRHYGGLGALDHELFDLAGAVDQAYWCQSQWTYNDHALYLP